VYESEFLQTKSTAGGIAMNSAHAPDEVRYIVVWNKHHCTFDNTTALQKQMQGSEVKKYEKVQS
jgi:hypothetical protein